MCKDVIERVGEAAIVELAPKLEGKKLMMILAPNPQFKKK
jgi:translation initiation factor IF-3